MIFGKKIKLKLMLRMHHNEIKLNTYKECGMHRLHSPLRMYYNEGNYMHVNSQSLLNQIEEFADLGKGTFISSS